MPHNDHMLVHHNGQDTFSLVKQRNTTTEDAKSLKINFQFAVREEQAQAEKQTGNTNETKMADIAHEGGET